VADIRQLDVPIRRNRDRLRSRAHLQVAVEQRRFAAPVAGISIAPRAPPRRIFTVRHAVLIAAFCLTPAVAGAADFDPAALDVSGSPLAHASGAALRKVLDKRAAEHFAGTSPQMVAGWTAGADPTGHVIYLQDDGTHNCDTTDINQLILGCLSGPNGAIDAYYGAYPNGNPHYVAIYTAWDNGFGGAFYQPVANDVKGIGVGHFTGGPDVFGDASKLQGFIFMNSFPLYNSYGAALKQFLFNFIWGQEFGHRWASFVHFDDHGTDSTALLGRQQGHWSYFMDTDWSWMEGNDWKKSGSGKWTTDVGSFDSVAHHSPLDLYLMGLVPKSAVSDFLLIDHPNHGNASAAPAALYGASDTVAGDQHMVSIDDIVKLEGEREPSYIDSPRRFDVTFLVVFRAADNMADTGIASDSATFVQWAQDLFATDTRHLARVDVNTGDVPPPANGLPVAALTVPADAKQGATATLDGSTSSDPDGDTLAYVWDFGDGTADFESGAHPQHKFVKSGDLTVTLTVVDPKGGADTATSAITVAAADGGNGCGCDLGGTGTSMPTFAGMIAVIAGCWIRRKHAFRG
jgi:hypothetical protein